MFMNATTNICYCDPTAIAATSTSCVCNRFATMTAGVCACETGYYAIKIQNPVVCVSTCPTGAYINATNKCACI